jgi:hypothetical protein
MKKLDDWLQDPETRKANSLRTRVQAALQADADLPVQPPSTPASWRAWG